MADMEFAPPKYAQIVTELRRRIQNGTYRPGEMLPSESQLVREFASGRTTVVRALQILQHDGLIDREHGRGSYVKGVPSRVMGGSRPGRAVLEQPETGGAVSVLQAGSAEVPRHVAGLLGVAEGSSAMLRRWVRDHDGQPAELVSCWFPAELVYGTDVDKPALLPTGIRQHLHALKHLRFDHIVERLCARLPTSEEVGFLQLSKTEPVLAVLATVHDATDRVLIAVDLALPGTLHELEDVYSVTS
jgi:GntR family transcriptional regulator